MSLHALRPLTKNEIAMKKQVELVNKARGGFEDASEALETARGEMLLARITDDSDAEKRMQYTIRQIQNILKRSTPVVNDLDPSKKR